MTTPEKDDRSREDKSTNCEEETFHVDLSPGWARYEFERLKDGWVALTERLGITKSPPELTEADVVGQCFKSLDEASAFYEMYSAAMGFGIRKSYLRYNVRGEPNNRTWVCCKEGQRSDKYICMPNRIRTARGLTREHCKAMLQVTLCRRSRQWKAKSFVIQHSHPLAAPPLLQFLRDKRVVCEGAKTVVENLQQSGVRTSKIMSFLAQSVGGYNNVRFIVKDLYNKIGREKAVSLSDGDAERAIGYLQGKADTDLGFYGVFSYDSLNRLCSLFWADGRSRTEYAKFGDVLSFDSTYKTNQYGKPLLVFVGVNNHYRSTVFGYALLADESNETYMWALSTFINCMEGAVPKSVITDGDMAMRNAITELMPKAVHRLCSWHIEKNIVAHVKEAGFLGVMSNFITRKYSPEEFERRWEHAIHEYGLERNEYLQTLFGKRELWADTYLRKFFFAGQCTTQRSEKMNAFLKTKVAKKMNLCEFLRAIDMANSWLRHKQVEDEYKQFWTKPVTNITNMSAIEEQAAGIYTPAIFYKVQTEMKREGKYIVQTLENLDGQIRAVLIKYADKGKLRNVMYNPGEDIYACECGLMTSKGIPCRHIFSTIKALQKFTLPQSLINIRWTRQDGSDDSMLHRDEGALGNQLSRPHLRFGHVSSKCAEVAAMASASTEAYSVAVDAINGLLTQLHAMVVDEGKRKVDGATPVRKVRPIRNPTYGTTKGGWRGSKAGGKGKKKCSHCQRPGHNKATCKMRGRNIDSTMNDGDGEWEVSDDMSGQCSPLECDDVDEEDKSFPIGDTLITSNRDEEKGKRDATDGSECWW